MGREESNLVVGSAKKRYSVGTGGWGGWLRTVRWTVDEFALCLESWWVMVASAEAALEAGRGWLVNWRPPELGVVPGRPGVVDQG